MPELTPSPQQDPTQEMLYRRQLRQERTAARAAEPVSAQEADTQAGAEARAQDATRRFQTGGGSSVREAIVAARRGIQTAKNAPAMAKDAVLKASQRTTAQALRFSWLNIISSFGLTLIYINIHFFAKYIGGLRLFCHFGEEWTLVAAGAGKEAAENEVETNMFAAIKIAEFIVLFMLDILAVGIIVALAICIFILLTTIPPLNLVFPAINLLGK